MTPTTTPAQTIETEPKVEVLLAPRVIDERAYRSLGERLRELVERAEETRGSLATATGRGGELLSSLEALAHTQTRRTREIRESLDATERRVSALEPAALEARMKELTTRGETARAEAERARAALEESVVEARRRAAEINLYEPTPAVGVDPIETQKLVAALAAQTERAENAARRVEQTAGELEGLKDQTNALLSAMRATILECAEARDGAEARLDRLTSAARKAEGAIETAEARVAEAEARAGRVESSGVDLDMLVGEVSRRVLAAMESRFETALARAGTPARAPEPRADAGKAEEALSEIRRSIELVSDATEAMREATRARRLATPPFGASGELGDPSRTTTVWNFTRDDLDA